MPTKKKTKLSPRIFQRAIRTLQTVADDRCRNAPTNRSRFSCAEVRRAEKTKFTEDGPHLRFYVRALSPDGHPRIPISFDAYKTLYNIPLDDDQVYTARIIALALAAELIKDGFTAEDFE